MPLRSLITTHDQDTCQNTASQKFTRNAIWIRRGGRADVGVLNDVLYIAPVGSKRNVVSTPENWVWFKAL